MNTSALTATVSTTSQRALLVVEYEKIVLGYVRIQGSRSADGLANGRMIRILSVVDAFTRECLVLEADTSLGSGRVTRALDRLIERRGQPESVCSDNGPEFTSRRMLSSLPFRSPRPPFRKLGTATAG